MGAFPCTCADDLLSHRGLSLSVLGLGVCVCICVCVLVCMCYDALLAWGESDSVGPTPSPPISLLSLPHPLLPSLPFPSLSLHQTPPSPLSLRTPTEMHSAWGRGQAQWGEGGKREGERGRREERRGRERSEEKGGWRNTVSPTHPPPLCQPSPPSTPSATPHAHSPTHSLTHSPPSTLDHPFASLVLQRDGASSPLLLLLSLTLASPKHKKRLE